MLSGKYKVTEVRQTANSGDGRYVILTPQHNRGASEGCLELDLKDAEDVADFTLGSEHTVTVTPVSPPVRPPKKDAK